MNYLDDVEIEEIVGGMLLVDLVTQYSGVVERRDIVLPRIDVPIERSLTT